MDILLGPGTTGAKQPERERESALGVQVHDVSRGGDHRHHHAHEFLFDWTFTSEAPLHMALVQELLQHLPHTVFRAKGFIYSIEEPDSRLVLQLVGRRATISPTRNWGNERPQT